MSQRIERAKQVIARCRKLATFSEDPSGTRRTFLSPPMRDCHRELGTWVQPLGANARIDAAGNWRAVYPAANPGAPRLLLGSHLDTVPNAGAYDGILGVVLAVSLLEELQGRRLAFGIEVIGSSEEEGVRFGTPFIGSLALIGRLDDEHLSLRDARGISVRQAIEDFGLDPEEVPQAALKERYPGLCGISHRAGAGSGKTKTALGRGGSHRRTKPTGVHICRPSQPCGNDADELALRCFGGGSRMDHCCRTTCAGNPGTGGYSRKKIEVEPGATNVIPGEARMSLDVRHGTDETRDSARDHLIHLARKLLSAGGCLCATRRCLISRRWRWIRFS